MKKHTEDFTRESERRAAMPGAWASTDTDIGVKIGDEGMVRNKAIHIALGVMADGTKVVLGLWIEQNEGAKF